jgi:hypothetical protein
MGGAFGSVLGVLRVSGEGVLAFLVGRRHASRAPHPFCAVVGGIAIFAVVGTGIGLFYEPTSNNQTPWAAGMFTGGFFGGIFAAGLSLLDFVLSKPN